jgi:hypothetical protein
VRVGAFGAFGLVRFVRWIPLVRLVRLRIAHMFYCAFCGTQCSDSILKENAANHARTIVLWSSTENYEKNENCKH